MAALAILAFLAGSGIASGTLVDFEGLADGTLVTDQYSALGVTFSGSAQVVVSGPGTILTAGISLDELEFPPHSGVNVVFDGNGPIFGNFSTPMTSVGAYFTYAETVTLTVFDASGQALTSAVSSYTQNYTSSGTGTPNEFISISDPAGFSSFEIAGDPSGGSFAMDDFTFSSPSVAVPESTGFVPGALTLLMLVLASRRTAKDPAPSATRAPKASDRLAREQ